MTKSASINNFYIFCAFDQWGIDVSFVFFSIFNELNSDKTLHIHCINFEDEIFEEYQKKVTSNYNNIILHRFTIEHNSDLYAIDDRESVLYEAHTEVLEHKIKFWASSEHKHILYLDTDLLIYTDIDVLLTDTHTNIVGSVLHPEKGFGYNAGVIVINQPETNTMFEQYLVFAKKTKPMHFPEEYTLDHVEGYTRGKFPKNYHVAVFNTDIKNPLIIHMFSDTSKPWSVSSTYMLTHINTNIVQRYLEWYKYFDITKQKGVLSEKFCKKVQEQIEVVNKILKIQTKIHARKEKLYERILQ